MNLEHRMDGRYIILRGVKKLPNGRKTPFYQFFVGDPLDGPCRILHAEPREDAEWKSLMGYQDKVSRMGDGDRGWWT